MNVRRNSDGPAGRYVVYIELLLCLPSVDRVVLLGRARCTTARVHPDFKSFWPSTSRARQSTRHGPYYPTRPSCPSPTTAATAPSEPRTF